MRLIVFIVVVTSIGLVAEPTRSLAQPQPYGVFRGWVVDSKGKPIGESSVILESDSFTRAVKPNGSGHFGIELPVGLYTITVTKSGFEPYRLTNVQIRRGGYVSHVFRLKSSDAARTSRFFSYVSDDAPQIVGRERAGV